MRDHIVIAGGSGFLGQALATYFGARDREVVVLSRTAGLSSLTARQVTWDGRSLGPWRKELEGAEAVINLSGKSVNCRYHTRNRREILESRVASTCVLGEAISRCTQPPPVWLNASTATIYRHTFAEPWDETGEIGATREAKDAFSIEVARAWEATLEEAKTPRTRKVAMRTAMVLGQGQNSVFPVLRRLARCGLGGRLGTGRQFVSWIHETDFCRAVEWLTRHDKLEGSVNLAAPNPLSNAEMMRTLRQVCRAPFGLPATNWMLEVGAFVMRTETELVVKSRRVVPGRLLESGFEFHFSTIRQAFEELCARRQAVTLETGATRQSQSI